VSSGCTKSNGYVDGHADGHIDDHADRNRKAIAYGKPYLGGEVLTAQVRNILFIMFDQLRFDYLSCAGHQTLHTPHIDALAERGVRFTHCYTQSPICGPSRMSFYTGRYVHSHGAAWNNFPLKVGELTLGDHLRGAGMDAWLVGKTHMQADRAGMARLGITADSVIGARVAECGFDIFERDDGLWANGPDGWYDSNDSPYNAYLKSRGYQGNNPWHDYANAGVTAGGEMATGWLMQYADKPANIKEEDSETPYTTRRAMAFIDMMREQGNRPWLCHLSYIKPHWPYIAPAPYHDMYRPADIQPVVRADQEKIDPHPVYAAYMNNPMGRAFSRDEVREKVIPAYMGLIKQCDDQMGHLFDYLQQNGHMNDTMIVITSDHGDYLGDHWLGEKDLFHDTSVKIPLIIYDPSARADATRGTTCDALVESIDVTATFVDIAAGKVPEHIIEGRSLRPYLFADPVAGRSFAVSEYDYSSTAQAVKLGVAPRDARLFMIADQRWKFMHAEGGFRPMLFDLQNDPNELNDLGNDQAYRSVIDEMYARLGQWARRPSQRTTLSDDDIDNMRGRSRRKGVLIGVYDEADVDEEILSSYRGPAPQLP
jgi:arylsulfatase A-like enzyme